MKRHVINEVTFLGYGHGEFFIEFIYKAHKAGNKIVELPYVHPPDIEGMSKTATSILKFCYLGFKYCIRIIQSLFRRN